MKNADKECKTACMFGVKIADRQETFLISIDDLRDVLVLIGSTNMILLVLKIAGREPSKERLF
jgi:hypothetical protein